MSEYERSIRRDGVCLRANTPAVTSERFDDEVVLVNFDDGRYHSIRGAGVEIWSRLETGAAPSQIVAHLRGRYRVDPPDLETAVASFLARLSEEALIVPFDGPTVEGPPDATGDSGRLEFVTPELTTYSDMQELLWLDPIHEVDESGWPVPLPPDRR